jgi:hypothetical protein
MFLFATETQTVLRSIQRLVLCLRVVAMYRIRREKEINLFASSADITLAWALFTLVGLNIHNVMCTMHVNLKLYITYNLSQRGKIGATSGLRFPVSRPSKLLVNFCSEISVLILSFYLHLGFSSAVLHWSSPTNIYHAFHMNLQFFFLDLNTSIRTLLCSEEY